MEFPEATGNVPDHPHVLFLKFPGNVQEISVKNFLDISWNTPCQEISYFSLHCTDEGQQPETAMQGHAFLDCMVAFGYQHGWFS